MAMLNNQRVYVFTFAYPNQCFKQYQPLVTIYYEPIATIPLNYSAIVYLSTLFIHDYH